MHSKMITLILASIFSHALFAQSFSDETASLRDVAINQNVKVLETWVKYTCSGAITPRGISNIKYADIADFYFPVKRGQKYPTVKQIQEEDEFRFERMAKLCTDRRMAMTDLTGYNGTWQGWDTVHTDNIFKISETIITSNACRPIGSPCAQSTQCCQAAVIGPKVSLGLKVKIPIKTYNVCNSVTNACAPQGIIASEK